MGCERAMQKRVVLLFLRGDGTDVRFAPGRLRRPNSVRSRQKRDGRIVRAFHRMLLCVLGSLGRVHSRRANRGGWTARD